MTLLEKQRIIKANMALGMTEAEAIQTLEDDMKIDRGEKCDWEVELTPEQKKAQRLARKADRAISNKPQARVKVENPDKKALLDSIFETVKGVAETDPVILNPERELEFVYNGVKYKITLSAPRK